MTDINIEQEVDALLIACLGCQADDLKPEAALVADLLADSMALTDMMLNLETRFGLSINEQQLEELNYVRDVYRIVAEHLS